MAPSARAPLTVAFPARAEPFKGLADAVRAMEILRHTHGAGLRAICFGAAGLPVPNWIDHRVRPSNAALVSLYNQAAVFLVPSHHEGWGLPGIEAMACGAALVTTDNGGCRDYAIDGQTALVVPPKAPDAMAAAVTRLFGDDALRQQLARGGAEKARGFSWQASADAIERFLIASGD